jgi:hypothetical protein
MSHDSKSAKVDDEPTFTISSEEPNMELDLSEPSASTPHPRLQSPLRNTLDDLPPAGRTPRFKVRRFELKPLSVCSRF